MLYSKFALAASPLVSIGVAGEYLDEPHRRNAKFLRFACCYSDEEHAFPSRYDWFGSCAPGEMQSEWGTACVACRRVYRYWRISQPRFALFLSFQLRRWQSPRV